MISHADRRGAEFKARMSRRLALAGSLALCVALLAQWAAQGPASAHPVSQGTMDIKVKRTKIALSLRVWLEEVAVRNGLRQGSEHYSVAPEALKEHGEYLLKHLALKADGQPLEGKLVSYTHLKNGGAGLSWTEILGTHVSFDFNYELSAPPGELTVSQDVLNDLAVAPGMNWSASYVLRAVSDEGEGREGLLLDSKRPLVLKFKWKETAVASPAGQQLLETPPSPTSVPETPKARVQQDRGQMFWDYARHGIKHILGPEEPGYDHLLFVCALVLGAASLWDLVKVVTAFTLAHSLTLTLCVFDIVRLNPRVVEPMIALSIVFVALENIFWPERTRGWGRLGAAFFFGLFHGLGFGGGLLDAMEGMGGGAIFTAIAAFSIGVELGHQAVVLPLFGALRLLRRREKDEPGRELVSKLTLKYGSVMISAGGIFFLIAALRWNQPPAPPPLKEHAVTEQR